MQLSLDRIGTVTDTINSRKIPCASFFYLSGDQYTKKKDSFMLLKGLTLRNNSEK